nr:hypothetical protein [Grifola frondosa]
MLYAINEYIVKLLFTYTHEKSPKIVINHKRAESKVNKITKENIEAFISTSPYSSRDIQAMLDIITKITSIESLDQSLIKLSSLNTPLMKNIKDFLDDTKLTNYEKQVYIEKTLIEYELDYFSKHMDTPEPRSKLLYFPSLALRRDSFPLGKESL